MKKILARLMSNKYKFYTNLILIILLTAVNVHLIYSILLLSGIENVLRVVVVIIIILMWMLFLWLSIRTLVKHKKIKYNLFLITSLIYIVISFLISFNLTKIYSKLSNVSNVYTNYSTSLVTNIENEVNSIDKIGDSPIGILNDENIIDGYQLPKEIIETSKMTNEIIYYDSYAQLFEALDNKDIEYIFVPTNYRIMFQTVEGINEMLDKTKIIYTKEKQVSRKITSKGKIIDKPFTILLMGVDSKNEDISSGTFNGDALMILTFNPTTFNTTIISIPRDSYVPISCFNGKRKNKITHAAWYGEDCMILTIENFLDIDIDYFFKINFKGVVKLVDTLGGIEVNVPYSFCEQDSNRKWGKNTVYVKKGKQTLNGEQALALSRNRNNNSHRCGSGWGISEVDDFTRGQNQQLVIKGLINKIKSIKKIDTVYELLDAVSINMETNMQTSEILSFYNIGKDVLDKSRGMKVDEILGFQRLYLSGYTKHIMDYSAFDNQGMRMTLYNFIPYKGSIKDVSEAMKINLGLKPKEIIKTLKFSVNDPYEEKVIGKGYYNETGIPLLPNFIGQQEIKAVEYANKYNFKLNINYITSDNPAHVVGQIVGQTPYADMDISYVKDITIDVVETLDIIETPDVTLNCSLEENKEHSSCLLPDFVGKDYSYFIDWLNKHKLSISINEEKITEDDPEYSEENIGKVIYQDKKAKMSIFDLIDDSLHIKYIEPVIDEVETTNPDYQEQPGEEEDLFPDIPGIE
ncbi:MAG: LCP family protein [Bacilli bacterium]|nr:LCP family protein [Bacilli bacterium]